MALAQELVASPPAAPTPAGPTITSPLTRDLRVDLARGMALLFIFVDHINHNPVAGWTLHRYSLIDAFDVFVFLSGYSLGLVYGPRMTREGGRACVRRAFSRCRTLYAAQLILAALLFAVLLPFAYAGFRLGDEGIYKILEQPFTVGALLVTMLHAPHYLNILPLYILLTLLAPFALYGFSKWPVRLMAGSFLLYSAVQFFPGLNLRSFPDNGAWSWSVFAWQFPFLISLWIGRATSEGARWSWLDSRWAVLGSFAGLAFLCTARRAVKAGVMMAPVFGDWLPDVMQFIQITLPETAKVTAHPVRILNLIVLIAAGRALLNWLPLHKSALLKPVIACGQNPLPVFVVGVLLSDLFSLASDAGFRSGLDWAVMNTTGVLILFWAAYCFRRKPKAGGA